MFNMQRLFFILLVLFSVETLNKADAASLIMVEQKFCVYCETWNADIGVIYNKTAEGKRAPLRRIDIHEPLPDDLNYLTGLIFTPTFVLVNDGKEVGRIQGYASESFFWGLLQKLLEKLPADTKTSAFETGNIFLARSQIDKRIIGKELVYD
jgi:thioredoxin-related protein